MKPMNNNGTKKAKQKSKTTHKKNPFPRIKKKKSIHDNTAPMDFSLLAMHYYHYQHLSQQNQ